MPSKKKAIKRCEFHTFFTVKIRKGGTWANPFLLIDCAHHDDSDFVLACHKFTIQLLAPSAVATANGGFQLPLALPELTREPASELEDRLSLLAEMVTELAGQNTAHAAEIRALKKHARTLNEVSRVLTQRIQSLVQAVDPVPPALALAPAPALPAPASSVS